MSTATYKCPKCSGAIKFDSKTQAFLCEYCDSTYTQEELDFFIVNTETITEETNKNVDNFFSESEEYENVNVYTCRFCGAEIVTDTTTVASTCPYCDNPVILTPELSGGKRPDYMIPFKITKEEAINKLKEFYKGKFLMPSVFKNENKIKEIKGLYVPFWLVDCIAKGETLFNATKVRHRSDSHYNYTDTSYYDVYRAGNVSFSNIPIDASKKMDNNYMDAIEPFFYKDIVPFNQGYMSGFYADRYDETIEENKDRIIKRSVNTLNEKFKETVNGYTSVTVKDSKCGVSNVKAKYALLPVWMLTTKYKDETYIFAINGQTGKIVGKLPIDKKKYWGFMLAVFIPLFAIMQTAALLI